MYVRFCVVDNTYREQLDTSRYWEGCGWSHRGICRRCKEISIRTMLRSLSTREGLRNSSSEPCAATHEFISSCRNSPKSGGQPSCDRQSLVAHRNQQIKRGFSSNIFVLVPVIFTVSLFFGTVFYRLHHGWELSTAFYFSAQVLAGQQVLPSIKIVC